MSIEILSRIKKERSTTGNARLCLIALADYADELGICWPGNKALAAWMNASSTTVKKCLASLEADGLVEIYSRSDKKQRLSNVYLLTGLLQPGEEVPARDRLSKVRCLNGRFRPKRAPQEPKNVAFERVDGEAVTIGVGNTGDLPLSHTGDLPPLSHTGNLPLGHTGDLPLSHTGDHDPSLDPSLEPNNYYARAREESPGVPNVPDLWDVDPPALPVVPAEPWLELQEYFIEKTARIPSGSAQLNEPKWKRPLQAILGAAGNDIGAARVRIDYGIDIALGNNPMRKRYPINSPASILNAALNYDPNPQPQNGTNGRPDKHATWERIVALMREPGTRDVKAALAAMNEFETAVVKELGGFPHLCRMPVDTAQIQYYRAYNSLTQAVPA